MPRFSRISWKSREDAEPPRIASSKRDGVPTLVVTGDAGPREDDVVLLGAATEEPVAGPWTAREQRPADA